MQVQVGLLSLIVPPVFSYYAPRCARHTTLNLTVASFTWLVAFLPTTFPSGSITGTQNGVIHTKEETNPLVIVARAHLWFGTGSSHIVTGKISRSEARA